MILQDQKIKIKWKSKKEYESKGYVYTGYLTELEVDIKDLSLNSSTKVNIQCDYCKSIYQKNYNVANKEEKHACQKCGYQKVKENNLKKYGVENPGQMTHVRKKVKQTCLEKYGVENAYKIKEVRQKVKDKLGVEYPFQSKEIQNKQKETMINIYGVENPSQVPEIREKVIQTNLDKYGVKCNLDIAGVREAAIIKTLETMYENGTGVCTKPQKYIYELLNNIEPCELNYPINRCQLDIALPNEMVYIEYNGGGHYAWDTIEDKEKDDMKRYSYLKQFKWKMIRIVCKCDKLYNDDKMIELIQECKEYLLNSNHSWIEINIDENKIKCKEYEKDI